MNDPRAGGASGFVDRLVVKAFGGADVAAPRMPSAYEPVRAHDGLTPDASRIDRIDDEIFGDDLMIGEGDMREPPDRWHEPRSATPRTADAPEPSAASAADDAEPSRATHPRHALSSRADAADGRDAVSRHARVMDDGATAGVLWPATGASEGHGLRRGDRLAGDHTSDSAAAAARIAGSDFDSAASRATSALTQRWPATAAAHATPVAQVPQPSARLRASLDSARFPHRFGHEEGTAGDDSRRAASDSSGRDGVLMPVANDVARHLASDRAGWREPAARGARGDDSTATPEVTVNVTIGRVDVRAVQAPAAAERPARTGGVRPVALDEYMAQRGGAR